MTSRWYLNPEDGDASPEVTGRVEALRRALSRHNAVRFAPERRADGGTERPNLFNPFWRASLATDAPATRWIVDIAKRLAPISSLTGGSGSCRT